MTSQSNDSRLPRDEQSREAESREKPWLPPNALPDPSPRPSMTHRWIRTSAMGQSDPVNVSTAFREGWVPVVSTEYPELKILSDHGSRWPESVEVGGWLLCSAPASLITRRREHYERMARAQMRRATRPMTTYSGSMPLEKKNDRLGAKSSIFMPRAR